jgi:hypothetical protein
METAGRRDRIGADSTLHGACPSPPPADKLGRLFNGLCPRWGLRAAPQPKPYRGGARAARVAALDSLSEKDAAASWAAAPLRHANEMSWFLSGTERMRLPVAAKNALSTAGAATKIVGSPTPPQNPPDGITIDSTLGISLMRITL